MRGASYRIGRLGLKLSTPAAILLLWAAPAASLPITYMEAGRLFTQFVSPYDGSMQIDGSVTFPTTLPANLSLQNLATSFATNGGTYSFSDGVMNYDMTDSTPVDLLFATDKNANIVAWQIEIFSNAGPIILLQNLPSLTDPGFDKVLSSSAVQMALSDGPATWTVVPEPAIALLTVFGLAGLGAAAGRRLS